jgi:DNA recombination protein RmuC
MLTTTLLMLFAALVSATITTLGVRSRVQARSEEAQELLRRQAKEESDRLRTELQVLGSAKAKLEGEATTALALTEQIAAKELVLDELRSSLSDTKSQLATATTRVIEVQRATNEALAAKEVALKEQLEEKERSLQAQLEEKQKSIDEQRAILAESEQKLTEAFDSLSVKALTTVSEQFMKTAKATLETSRAEANGDLKLRTQAIEEMLKPVSESIVKLQQQHEALETKRVSAFDAIEKSLMTVAKETDQLANALRKPMTRGLWAESILHGILTNAGLVEGVHFDVQHSTEDDESTKRVADVIIRLPHGRTLIIDSKAALEAYWNGAEATEETVREAQYAAHARLVRDHVKQLSSKSYWSRYKTAPECVVMFMPHEGAYIAAVDADSTLLSDARENRVYIANPMTVMNMVHIAAILMKEDCLRQNAHAVQLAASELYDRLSKFVSSFDDLGRSMRQTVDKYNKSAGCFQSRVLPSGRKVRELGAGAVELGDVRSIDVEPRELTCPEVLTDQPVLEARRLRSKKMIAIQAN